MGKYFLLGMISLYSFCAEAQSTILKSSSLNRMMDLVMHDSVAYFKGEEKKDEYGGIYHIATLPKMGDFTLNIVESPKQTYPWSFRINIPTPKSTTFPRIKSELRLLIRAKSLNNKMVIKEDYEGGLVAVGDGFVFIQVLYNEAEKNTTVSVFKQESY